MGIIKQYICTCNQCKKQVFVQIRARLTAFGVESLLPTGWFSARRKGRYGLAVGKFCSSECIQEWAKGLDVDEEKA